MGGHFTVNVGAQSYDNLVAVDSINGNPFIWNLTADGDVYALSINGSTVYAGGYFTTLGSITRNGLAAIDDNTGSILSWDPNVIKTGDKATIYALALSGNTLFAGGNFTNVGGMNHNDLVAIDISGNPLDWNIDTNDSVYALTTKGNIVYAGGRFTNIGGIGYRNIAVLDGTAHMILSWSNNVNQEVRTLAVGGDQIYIGGYFNSLGGIVRNHLAALDGNGNLRSWAPAVTGRTVDSLAIIDNNVYVGGDFTTVNGQGYNNLTAIDTTGNPLSWNPDVNNSVNTLAVSGNVLYLGGSFTAIGSTPVTRNYLAAFDTGNGSLLPWDPSANGTVNALAVISTAGGDTIYAGGNFTQVAGQNRNYLARILPDGSLDPAWDPNANGTVAALAVQSLPSGDTVYVGGDFSGFGNNPTVMQNFLACIQPTGIVDPNWNPAANGAVTALAISSNTLYTAGAFTGFGSSTNTQPRNYLAAIDTTNGNLLPWNPITSSNLPSIAPWITSIKISGGKVYAGGVNFSTIDGDFTGFTTLLP